MQTDGCSDGYASQFKMQPTNEITKDSLINLNVQLQVADGDNTNNENNHSGDVGKLIMTAVQESIHSKNSKTVKIVIIVKVMMIVLIEIDV